MNKVSSLEPIYWLKEVSESWVYYTSDVLVYLTNAVPSDADDVFGIIGVAGTYIEKYLNLNLWFEIFLKVRRQGELEYYVALIQACERIIGGKELLATGRANQSLFTPGIIMRCLSTMSIRLRTQRGSLCRCPRGR